MHEFLAGTAFRYFVFPIAGAVLGIAIKYVTRNDQYAKFRKEDLAVGLELLLTATLMFIALTSDRAVKFVTLNRDLSATLRKMPVNAAAATQLQASAQAVGEQLAIAGWIIALLFVALWSVSTLVRKWGWKNETEMSAGVGVAAPLAIGILALGAVMAGASR